MNLFNLIDGHATREPERTAIRLVDGVISYADLCRASRQAGERLQELGVGPGDRVVLAAPSVPEFVFVYFGIQALGATVIPVNVVATEAEIAYVLQDSGPAAVVAWQGVAPGTEAAAKAAGVPLWSLGSWSAEQASAAAPALEPVDRTDDDVAAILYTSGTTGLPKGVMLTIANVRSAGEICAELSRGGPDERVGTALPLFHVFGQSSVMMMTFTLGGSLSLLPRFEPAAMLELIARDGLTIVCGVPTMWNAMVNTESDHTAEDFAALRIAVSGGAVLPPAIARAFESRFGCSLLDGYGLTESTSIATFSELDRPRQEGFTGPAAPRISVRVVDEHDVPVPVGEVGEVQVQSPTVMSGYLNQPEATAEAFTQDGWLRTGDLGQINDDGDLRIVDRRKDLIVRGGFNVYPAEVEAVLYQHPDVLEAAVLGYPDAHLGERVAAVVTPRPGAEPSADDLRAFVAERLSYYKVPSQVAFVAGLPRGGTGKILKRDIRVEDLLDQHRVSH